MSQRGTASPAVPLFYRLSSPNVQIRSERPDGIGDLAAPAALGRAVHVTLIAVEDLGVGDLRRLDQVVLVDVVGADDPAELDDLLLVVDHDLPAPLDEVVAVLHHLDDARGDGRREGGVLARRARTAEGRTGIGAETDVGDIVQFVDVFVDGAAGTVVHRRAAAEGEGVRLGECAGRGVGAFGALGDKNRHDVVDVHRLVVGEERVVPLPEDAAGGGEVLLVLLGGDLLDVLRRREADLGVRQLRRTSGQHQQGSGTK